MAVDTAERDQWKNTVGRIQLAIHSQESIACPECGALLHYHNGELTAVDPTWSAATELEIERIGEYTQALELCERTVGNTVRDLAAAEAATQEIAALEKTAPRAVDEDMIRTKQSLIASLMASLNQLKTDERAMDKALEHAHIAQEQTINASAAHAEVQSWLKIANLLSPCEGMGLVAPLTCRRK